MTGRDDQVADDSQPLGLADRALSDKVYEALRERIIEGELPPGTRLREQELAERFHVSRLPVREALPRLEMEGFICSIPRRGSVVSQLTLRDVRDLFDVRSSLEVLVARLAARNVAEGASTARLSACMQRAEEAAESAGPREIATSNVALHEALTALADNHFLTTFMTAVNGRLQWLFRLTSDRDPRALCREHHELVEAILSGDEEAAATRSLTHVERGRTPSLRTLKDVLPDA